MPLSFCSLKYNVVTTGKRKVQHAGNTKGDTFCTCWTTAVRLLGNSKRFLYMLVLLFSDLLTPTYPVNTMFVTVGSVRFIPDHVSCKLSAATAATATNKILISMRRNKRQVMPYFRMFCDPRTESSGQVYSASFIK